MAFNTLPESIQRHLQSLSAHLPENSENPLENLARVWEEKETLFREQIYAIGMELAESVNPALGNGILALTSSGSLLSLGPGKTERRLEYASIKIRTDVPDILVDQISRFPADITCGKPARFPAGRISKTSAVYMIAACASDVPIDEQDKRIREATIYLTNGFMQLNRSLHLDPSSVPDQFTMKSMVRYIAKKNGTTAAEAKRIIDEFLLLVETGMCLGEKIPLGRIGRFSLKWQEARKARLVKHPGTGKEITVEAKPATAVPRISFSSYLKERLAEIPQKGGTIER